MAFHWGKTNQVTGLRFPDRRIPKFMRLGDPDATVWLEHLKSYVFFEGKMERSWIHVHFPTSKLVVEDLYQLNLRMCCPYISQSFVPSKLMGWMVFNPTFLASLQPAEDFFTANFLTAKNTYFLLLFELVSRLTCDGWAREMSVC